jgi:hypothetical protein
MEIFSRPQPGSPGRPPVMSSERTLATPPNMALVAKQPMSPEQALAACGDQENLKHVS